MPILLAVPHAGRCYPPDLLRALRNPDEARLRLEDRLIDRVAERVADATGVALLVAHAPRAMIDLNRDPCDVDWTMVAGGAPPGPGEVRLPAGRRAAAGLGLVPRRLAGLGELWNQPLDRTALQQRLDQVHSPYHCALAAALAQLCERWGSALLIDLHSMPPLGPKSGRFWAPDFVVGDRFGTACSPLLSRAALALLSDSGAAVAHNRPYAGGYVLARHGAPARAIHALQVEVCRSTYLDERLAEETPQAEELVARLCALLHHLARLVLGQPGVALLAAE